MNDSIPLDERPIIIGAGIAGVSAAVTLAERGIASLVLEADPVSIGGRVAYKGTTKFTHAGRNFEFSIEHGIHGWWTQYRNFLGMLERHGLSRQLVRAHDQTLIYDDGNAPHLINVGKQTQDTMLPEPIHHAPLLLDPTFRKLLSSSQLTEMMRLGLRVLEAVRLDAARSDHRRHYDGLSVADFVDGMPLMFRHFLYCLTRSGFFADPESVSLFAFLSSLQFYVFLRKDSQRFSFARGAIVPSLMTPLASFVQERGGQFRLGTRVERVARNQDGSWTIRAGDAQFRTRDLILALDVQGAQALQRNNPDLQQAYGDLRVFSGLPSAVVRHFWLQRPSLRWSECGVLSGIGTTADAFFWLDRFQDEFAQWHQQTGGSVSECHVYSMELQRTCSDQELMARVERDMTRTFPSLSGSSVHSVVVRNAPTNTNFPIGSDGRFPSVQTPFDNLSLCGDWVESGSMSFFMERACQTGVLAANQVLTRRGRQQATVLQAHEPPAHVQALQRMMRGIAYWPAASGRR